MNNFQFIRKESHAGGVFSGVSLGTAGIPFLIRSLASMMGLTGSRTKRCPFCEETLEIEASACRFCNRVLMKHIEFKTPG